MDEWLLRNPRFVRGVSIAMVIIGTVAYIRLIRVDAELARRIAERANEARTASEALGG